MSNEWTDLKDMTEVCVAQQQGWEIERKSSTHDWHQWQQTKWEVDCDYRGRPKKITVTSECWRNKHYGGLSWGGGYVSKSWQRFPAGDITGEVEV